MIYTTEEETIGLILEYVNFALAKRLECRLEDHSRFYNLDRV